jgi:hypothetical protein
MSRDEVAEGDEIMASEDSAVSVVEKRADRAALSFMMLALPAVVMNAVVEESDKAAARVAAAAVRMCFVMMLWL